MRLLNSRDVHALYSIPIIIDPGLHGLQAQLHLLILPLHVHDHGVQEFNLKHNASLATIITTPHNTVKSWDQKNKNKNEGVSKLVVGLFEQYSSPYHGIGHKQWAIHIVLLVGMKHCINIVLFELKAKWICHKHILHYS